MEIKITDDKIEFEKNLSSLDMFVIDFVSVLEKIDIKYVIVSGYVSILFGRNRSSEDIDIIIEKMPFAKFKKLWEKIYLTFECINSGTSKDAYNSYLSKSIAIRFARKNDVIPNVEIKFPNAELDYWALQERKKVLLNNELLFISPLELQISFKLFLGSEKDIEDARHLYRLFKDKLDSGLLREFNRKLKIEKEFNLYLR